MMRYALAVLALSVALLGIGCSSGSKSARRIVVADADSEIVPTLRRSGTEDALIENLTGGGASGSGRPQSLLWEAFFGEDWDHLEHIWVFGDLGPWPGTNPITIIYADKDNRVRAWLARDDEPSFVMAYLRKEDEVPRELRVFSHNRWGGGTHIGIYRIAPNQIVLEREEIHPDIHLGRLPVR